MSSVYSALVIAVVSQLSSDYETQLWQSKAGYVAHFGILMFLVAIPGLVASLILEAGFTLQSDGFFYAYLLLWLGVGGGGFMYYGLTKLIESTYSAKYQASHKLKTLWLDAKLASTHFDSYLKHVGGDFNALVSVDDFKVFVVHSEHSARLDKKHLFQKCLSMFAERLVEKVFEDRVRQELERPVVPGEPM